MHERLATLEELARTLAIELAAERSHSRDERDRTLQFQHAMLGILGHDLRAPLGGIITSTEMLATATIENPSAATVTARIASFAKRMTRIVDQVLDMTRVSIGAGIALARCETRLSPLIRTVVQSLATTHPRARIELVAASEVSGLWDPDRVAQVASALLTNAVQYGLEDAPIHVAVSHSHGAATLSIRNELRDQPIPAEQLATLFEPYHRGEHTYASQGLGLDLYLAHEIVRAHGGTIAVQSVASGTTFEVVLPEYLALAVRR
jgi:phosphoserine phosphatase RsbU/P